MADDDQAVLSPTMWGSPPLGSPLSAAVAANSGLPTQTVASHPAALGGAPMGARVVPQGMVPAKQEPLIVGATGPQVVVAHPPRPLA